MVHNREPNTIEPHAATDDSDDAAATMPSDRFHVAGDGAAAGAPGNGTTADSRSIANLIKELRDETTLLLRQEVALAKTEIAEKAAKAAWNAAYLAIGAVIGLISGLFLLLTVSFLLTWGLIEAGVNRHVSYWLAPLILAVIIGGVAAALIGKAIATFRDVETLAPRKTIDSLQENKQWATQKVTM
jgi:hypothetical protein